MSDSDLADTSYEELVADAARTRRWHLEANARRIAGLKIGQSHSECLRLSHDDHTRAELKRATYELANDCRAAIQRARIRAPEKDFCTDQGSFRTADYDIILLFVITRIT